MATPPAVQKALDRIRAVVESGSSYEAQQMYKTAYHRHKAKKQLQESYIVLKEGAAVQLRHEEVTSGVELGLLLLEAYKADKAVPDAACLASITDIIDAFPGPPGGNGASAAAATASTSSGAAAGGGSTDAATARIDECSRFVVAAVKWAQRNKASRVARQIHVAFARHLWREQGWHALARATLHFVRGDDATAFAEVLASCGPLVSPQERDLLLARAVLQVLAVAGRMTRLQQLAHARLLFDESMRLGVCEADTPLVHFIDMLLQVLDKGSSTLLRLLRSKYAASLSRDECLGEYLTKVEQVYFNTSAGSGGLLGGLLKQLAGGEDGDDGEEEYEDAEEEEAPL